MAPTFSKEAILQGNIDHLCLVCESYLRSEREMTQHVATPAHSHNLDSTDYVEKYRHDRIRRVKKWYFCEFCNVLTFTMAAVGLHVEEPRHKENKYSLVIYTADKVIIAGNITIQEEAWHGFIENTCTVCNEEYEDEDKHKSGPSHVINLIQSKVTNANNSVYRQIDNSTFHCLTCNEIVAEITVHLEETKHKNVLQECIRNTLSKPVEDLAKDEINCGEGGADDVKSNDHEPLDTNVTYITYLSDGKTRCTLCDCSVNTLEVQIHLDSSEHLNMLKNINKGIIKSNPNINGNGKDILDIMDSVPKFKKHNIDINCKSRLAVCTKCSVTLEFNIKVIENHIEEHKKNIQEDANRTIPLFQVDENNTSENKTISAGTSFHCHDNEGKTNIETKPIETEKQTDRMNDIQKMAEEHGLIYNSSTNKVHCQACNKRVPQSVKSIEEHVNGELHKNKVRKTKKPRTFKQNNITVKTHVKMCQHQKIPTNSFIRLIGTHNGYRKDVILNEKFCINYHCFTFLTNIERGVVRCQVCEVNIATRDISPHVKLNLHLRALLEVPVVLYSESEFIREIRSEIFQCGFCNIIDNWKGMEDHLNSVDHEQNKKKSNYRLTEYMLHLDDDRECEYMNSLFLMYFLDESFN